MAQEVVLVQVLEGGLAEEADLEAVLEVEKVVDLEEALEVENVAVSVSVAEQEVVPVVALEVARAEEVG